MIFCGFAALPLGIRYIPLHILLAGNRMATAKDSISAQEWREMAKEGELCSVFGCLEKPTGICPQCKTYYCYEHIKTHFHAVK